MIVLLSLLRSQRKMWTSWPFIKNQSMFSSCCLDMLQNITTTSNLTSSQHSKCSISNRRSMRVELRIICQIWSSPLAAILDKVQQAYLLTVFFQLQRCFQITLIKPYCRILYTIDAFPIKILPRILMQGRTILISVYTSSMSIIFMQSLVYITCFYLFFWASQWQEIPQQQPIKVQSSVMRPNAKILHKAAAPQATCSYQGKGVPRIRLERAQAEMAVKFGSLLLASHLTIKGIAPQLMNISLYLASQLKLPIVHNPCSTSPIIQDLTICITAGIQFNLTRYAHFDSLSADIQAIIEVASSCSCGSGDYLASLISYLIRSFSSKYLADSMSYCVQSFTIPMAPSIFYNISQDFSFLANNAKSSILYFCFLKMTTSLLN